MAYSFHSVQISWSPMKNGKTYPPKWFSNFRDDEEILRNGTSGTFSNLTVQAAAFSFNHKADHKKMHSISDRFHNNQPSLEPIKSLAFILHLTRSILWWLMAQFHVYHISQIFLCQLNKNKMNTGGILER